MPTQTTQDLLSYYANLLIYQYVSQWRAWNETYAILETYLMAQGYEYLVVDNEGQPVVDNEGDYVYIGSFIEPILPLAVQQAFNFPGAVGVQLDTLAKYLGGERTNSLLNGVPYTFNDADFTTYLQLLAIRNNMPSDLGDIEQFLYDNFTISGDQILSVTDFADMHMGFTYTALIGTYPIFEAFITSGDLPKPMGVGASLIYNPQKKNFFAFRSYEWVAQAGTVGFNYYSGPQDGTFLGYSYGVEVPF
jgi:hypothetical protein